MTRRTLAIAIAALLVAACSATSEPAGSAPDTTTTTTIPSTTTFAPLVETTTTTTVATPTTEAAGTTTAPEPVEAPIEITTTPADGDVVDTYVVQFAGTAAPDADVEVNGEAVIVDRDGSFSVPIRSEIGVNGVSVVATSAGGTEAAVDVEYSFEPTDGWIEAIGDSVMLGAAEELESRLGDDIVDADVSRQFPAAAGLIQDLMTGENPPQAIVVHLGTNGLVDDAQFDRVMLEAAEVPLVVFVNIRVPRDWEAPTNTALAAGVERWDNAILVDWFGASDEDDSNFAGDGFHPSLDGRALYAELIAEAVFPGSATVGL